MKNTLYDHGYNSKWTDVYVAKHDRYHTSVTDFHEHDFYEINLILSGNVKALAANQTVEGTDCKIVLEKVGVMYGNPETTTGGRALKFYASVRMDVRRGEQLKNGSEVVGNRTKVKIVKNKVAPPFRVAEFDIIYGEGISKWGSLLDMAVERDIIHKSGAWFSYEDQRIGQGRENARLFLKNNPDIAKKIDQVIREEAAADLQAKLQGNPPPVSEDEEDPDLALLDEEV